MTIKYLIRDDGVIFESSEALEKYGAYRPYTFPQAETQPVVLKKKSKELTNGNQRTDIADKSEDNAA